MSLHIQRSGITGEITYVDGGYNIVGMAPLTQDA
jgi:enoyl-[acyl-carrier-protein] reductase (NADH)